MASNVNVYSGLPLGVTPPPSFGDSPNTDATRTFLDTYLTDGPTVGLYIGGSIEQEGYQQSLVQSGTSTFFGTIFANETIRISGDMAIYGSVAAVGDVIMSGKTVVWYETGHDSILLPLGAGSGAPMPEGLRLLSYVEW